ncbi:MAG: BTAD domain-containing putative transcriptional regulator [Egibacteraceae bacterium]
MEFRILGPLEVVDRGHPVAVGGERQRALLALLLMRPNEVVSVDRLLDGLWEGSPPQSGRKTLRSHVSRLRKVLGGAAKARLLARASGYVLELDVGQLDATHFQRLVTEGREALAQGDLAAASATLRQALELWRGQALAEFASASWIQAEIAHLEELRLAATEDRIQADLAMGRHGELVGELELLVAEHPLRERLWSQLILALYRSGRQAEALQAYQQLRHRLSSELGIEPSLGLRRLEEGVLRQQPELDWIPPEAPEPGTARPTGTARHNLPAQLTTFVGREAEIAKVGKLVEAGRLVTLTGAGGCGKTRLALEVAAALLQGQPDGAWFVDLAPLADPDLVPITVAADLGVPEEAGRPLVDLLVDHLRPRRLLLMLDNCEHLVSAVAELVDRLLRACSGLRVLVTSREVLGVPGEVAWRVPSLSSPDPDVRSSPEELVRYESVRLFLERARATRVERSPGAEDMEAVAAVCARLDGIPLAIELAAARTAVLSVGQIAARLDDRFRLLTTGSRTALPRHQTLRAAVEWSHDLLELSERTLFRRLAVFAGSFMLEAAETVCSEAGVEAGDVLDLLAQLVGKSVVLMDDRGSSDRYRLPETIRQYAREQLIKAGEHAQVRSRHRDWYLRLAEGVEAQAFGIDGQAALEWLDVEHDNFRAALEWSLEDPGGTEAGLRLTHALNPLWLLRGHCREGLVWMEALSGRPGGDHAMASAVLRRAANLAWRMGDLSGAVRLSDQALALARRSGGRRHVGAALKTVGGLAMIRGELERARALLTESVTIGRELGDQVLVNGSLLWLAWVIQRQGRYREARARIEEFLASTGEESWYNLARALYLLGQVEFEQGQYPAARERLFRSRALAASAGNREYEAMALEALGAVAAAEGSLADARSAYEEALSLYRTLPQLFVVGPHAALGELALVEGDYTTAQTLMEKGLARAQEIDEAFLQAWTNNRLGRLAAARGDADAARSAYEEALGVGQRAGMPWHVAATLEGLAALDGVAGQPDHAARLLGAAEAIRAGIGAPRWPSLRDDHERVVGVVRAALGETAFAAAQAEGRALTLAQAAALALAHPP